MRIAIAWVKRGGSEQGIRSRSGYELGGKERIVGLVGGGAACLRLLKESGFRVAVRVTLFFFLARHRTPPFVWDALCFLTFFALLGVDFSSDLLRKPGAQDT